MTSVDSQCVVLESLDYLDVGVADIRMANTYWLTLVMVIIWPCVNWSSWVPIITISTTPDIRFAW